MSATRILSWLLLPLLWQWCPQVLALNPALDISQYAHTAWRAREGFLTGTISAIAQGPDGYLWLGTDLGLVRFDGVRTVLWQPPVGVSLPDNRIFSLLATRDGTLWVGTSRGLVSLKDGRLIAYPQLEGAVISSLLEDQTGTVWAGAYFHFSSPRYGVICAMRIGRTECYGEKDRLAPVLALWADTHGALWVSTETGVWRWTPGPPKLYSLPSPVAFNAFAETPAGAIIVSSEKGVNQIIGGEVKPLPLPHLPRRFVPTSVLCDQDGAIWIGSTEAGLLHVHDDRTDWFTLADGLSGDHTNQLFEDREGNIWVPTETGLDRFHVRAATTYSTPQGLVGSTAGVLAGSNGDVWFSTSEGIYRWRGGHFAVYRRQHRPRASPESATTPVLDETLVTGLPEDPAASLYQDRSGRLWIGTRSEVGYVENNRLVPLVGMPGGYIDSFAEDNEGNLWMAYRDAGLLRLSPDLKTRERLPWKRFGASGVARLAADPTRGGLWIGSYSGGVVYFSNGEVGASYGAREGLGEGPVNDLRVAGDGTIWVATDGGLSIVKAGRITTLDSRSGLPCDAIESSVDDSEGWVWLYTHCGLVRVATSDLDRWVAAAQKRTAPNETLPVTVLGEEEGVRSFSFSPTYSPHMARAADGRLWMASRDGVTVVDPKNLPLNKLPPPVHIEEVVADRIRYLASSPLHLPPRLGDLEVDYTALSLVAPEKVRFRYKLESHDRDWQNVGNRRQAFYTDLTPGNYRFRVIASNNSGVWNEQGAALDFSIAPAYWQTNWFRAACAAAFLLVLWALYQLRLRQIRQAFNARLEERVAERTRIARELHDTLLQSFQGLLLRFHTVRKLLRMRPAEAEELLESAIDQTARAITESRTAVQGLRASTLERNDLAVAIRTLGEELAADPSTHASVGLQVDVEGTPHTLHPIVRDEIYRIAGEALRNAFRHAAAKQIEVELRYAERQFRLRIRDDGKGIDPSILTAEAPAGHFGLHGMRERAKLVRGELTVWTAPGSGTEIELNIPAAYAYAAATGPRRSWLAKLAGKTESTL